MFDLDAVIAIIQASVLLWLAIFGTLLIVSIILLGFINLCSKVFGHTNKKYGNRETFEQQMQRFLDEGTLLEQSPMTEPIVFEVPSTKPIELKLVGVPQLEDEIAEAIRVGNDNKGGPDAQIIEFKERTNGPR